MQAEGGLMSITGAADGPPYRLGVAIVDIVSGMFAAQVFFPGSMPPSHPAQFRAYEAAGFRVIHRSVHDYRPTLRAWFDNLVANQEQALKLVGMKTINKYVAFFPGSYRYFDDQQAYLIRYVLEKPPA